MKKLPRFRPDQQWHETSARGLNDLTERVEAIGKMVGAGGTAVGGGLTGFHIKAPAYDKFALYQLTEAVQWPDPTRTAGSASESDVAWVENCHIVRYHPADYEYQTFADDVQTIYIPNSFRTANSIGIGLERWGNGDQVLAGFNRQSGRWEALAPPLSLWRFELKDDLAPGGQATAYLLQDVAGTLTPNTDIEFEVYDRQSKWRGRARNESPDPDVSGSQGWAQYVGDSQQFEIIDLQPHVQVMTCLVNEAQGVKPTDSTFEVDGQTKMQPTDEALWQSATGVAPTTVTNTGLFLNDDEEILCLWDDSAAGTDGEWICIGSTSGGTGTLRFGVVQAGFTNALMDAQQTVSVKSSDSDGSSVSGNAYNVLTPIQGAQRATSLFTGDVVGFQPDKDGNLIIVTPCADDPFGVGKMWVNNDSGVPNTPPPGWEVMDNAYTIGKCGTGALRANTAGNVIAGHTGSGDYTSIGDTFGADVHVHPDHAAADIVAAIDDHPAHAHCGKCGIDVTTPGDASGTAWDFTGDNATTDTFGPQAHAVTATDVAHGNADHRDKGVTAQWIVRTS